ncbi:uncharacterized protein BJ171DRAFT_490744 [Polychytrium aggregatum]|uniref:uncharacterized protein n=1 Tax=Polychytrium aggregatum TaxID=110093 RepID=UPI0022FE2339|nr:uncharacterized protein BJ171DRAFT_490744 [Polychytrium aggregatum]KAI9208248.1 hypothetical protein BJ171DRAFT_490744 [Polychytrium aggregatum]
MFFRALARSARPLAARVAPFARGYASDATPAAGKLLVNFVVPHQSILKNFTATQVNLVSADGDMGILADHVPTIAQLAPGVIEVFGADKPQKFFVSGGFAIINPDSTLNINAVEAYTLEDVDFESARRALDESNRKASSTTLSETDKAEAKIEIEVLEALVAAAQHK